MNISFMMVVKGRKRMKIRKKVIIIVVVISLIIVSTILITVGNFVFYKKNNDMYLMSPTAIMNFSSEEDGYIITIKEIESAPNVNKWLKLDKVYYLLSPSPLPKYGDEYFPLLSENGTTEEYFRALMGNDSNPFNIASGILANIQNNTKDNITYSDNDDDFKISENDTILFDNSLLSYNYTEEKFLLNLIYIGDLEGSLSEEIFENIGYIKIENLG
jgi:hypothetical protein